MAKRIVVIAEHFPPRLGASRRIFEIMKRMAKKYDIHFVVLPPPYVLFVRKIESVLPRENQIFCENMTGHVIGLPRWIWKLWIKGFLLPYILTITYLFQKATKKLIQLRPDIVVVEHTSAYTGLVGFACSKFLSKKLLVEYNDLQAIYATMFFGQKINNLVKNMLILIEDTIVRNGWKVIAISDFIKKYAALRNIRNDVVVIPDGVDLDMFDPTRADGREIRSMYAVENDVKLCIYTGRIEKVVGAEIILETARILEKREDVKFIIVGEGDPQMMSRLSQCKNVFLTGLVTKENVPRYLAAADVVLVPFVNTILCHGISPLKLFEGMAMEKAVIASAVSGVKDVITNNLDGILVSFDPKDWAKTIIDLTGKPETAIELGRNARRTVSEKYSWVKLANAFGDVIEMN